MDCFISSRAANEQSCPGRQGSGLAQLDSFRNLAEVKLEFQDHVLNQSSSTYTLKHGSARLEKIGLFGKLIRLGQVRACVQSCLASKQPNSNTTKFGSFAPPISRVLLASSKLYFATLFHNLKGHFMWCTPPYTSNYISFFKFKKIHKNLHNLFWKSPYFANRVSWPRYPIICIKKENKARNTTESRTYVKRF